jgi:hypothetical protein
VQYAICATPVSFITAGCQLTKTRVSSPPSFSRFAIRHSQAANPTLDSVLPLRHRQVERLVVA